MKTTRIIKTMVAVAGLGLASACTDLVTKEVDSRVVTTSDSGTTNSDAKELLTASYNDLQLFTDQASIYSMMEHTTDELIPPTRGVDWSDNGVWRSLYQHTWDPAHSNIQNAWNSLNQNAFRVSLVLDASNATAQQKAEAKFIRALNRFYVMDCWGQLPVRKTSDGANVNPQVLDRSAAFDLIVQDLTEALPDLQEAPPAAPNLTATKAAANALLARLFLNKAVYKAANPAGPYTFDNGDMDKVISYANAVKASGYALSPYYDNFKDAATSKEIILSSVQGSPQNRVYMTLHYNQNPSGWNGFATLADFYAKFQTGDIRKGIPTPLPNLPYGNTDASKYAGIGLGFLAGIQRDDAGNVITDTRTSKPLDFTGDVPLSGAATNKGIRVMKYHPAFYGKYVLLRYADVYLMAAEAKMRKGDNAGALADVNALRANRGAAALPTLDAQAMLDERGRELYWEGIRRTDLIRFGKFNDDWAEKGTNKDAFRVLFTIPQQAVDSNPNLKQNPGYSGS